MDITKRRNFTTPGGLKIRLNHHYFFCQLVKPERYYTDEEIVNNDTMYNATANIETMYMIPTMLVQFFSLFAIIFHIDIATFCGASVALYLFGCIWRCSKQDFLISTALMFLSTIYKALYWLCYIALIVLAFVLHNTYLIIPYIVTRIILFVISLVLNHIVVTITNKKYGTPFNDTEICAFVVFHLLSQSTERLSDYIWSYVSAICAEEEKMYTNAPATDAIDDIDELTNAEPLSEEEKIKIEDEMKATKFVNFHILTATNGRIQKYTEVTEESKSLIDKWLDKETNSIYCFEVYKEGVPQYYYTSKEMFETAEQRFNTVI